MRTDVYIIPDFSGAEKTTPIDRLLREIFDPWETVVIENDFDEASLDIPLICSDGFAAKKLNAGCICCSLTDDFQAAILEVLREFSPKQILIKPSGVGKLFDVEGAYHSARIADMAQIRRKIIVADVMRCHMYLGNFGEFYEDQVRHADAILLSRTRQNPNKVSRTKALLTAMAPKAQLFAGAWKSLDLSALLSDSAAHAADCHEEDYHHDRPHEHRHHDRECDHGHSAHKASDTVTPSLSRTVTRQELEAAFHATEADRPDNILRAKGVVSTPKGPATARYLPGELNLAPCTLRPDSLCPAGSNLHERELKRIFGKKRSRGSSRLCTRRLSGIR